MSALRNWELIGPKLSQSFKRDEEGNNSQVYQHSTGCWMSKHGLQRVGSRQCCKFSQSNSLLEMYLTSSSITWKELPTEFIGQFFLFFFKCRHVIWAYSVVDILLFIPCKSRTTVINPKHFVCLEWKVQEMVGVWCVLRFSFWTTHQIPHFYISIIIIWCNLL